MMKLIPLAKTKSNSIVAKTLYDSEGRVLLNVGAQLTDNLINKLISLNINSLYVTDESYEEVEEINLEVKELIKDEVRDKLVTLIKSTFISVDNSSTNYYFYSTDDYFKKFYELAETILDDIFENTYLSNFVVEIKIERPTIFSHSVNVAVISLIIGIYLNYDRTDLINLCVGALLHDIGKSLIDVNLIAKETPLTYDEFEIVKGHPEKGYYYLYDKEYIHSDIKQIILQHHERIDGLGYPNGIMGNQINKMAKIVSVADVYDTLTSETLYIDSMSASDAIEYIMSHVDNIFDFEIVDVFSKIIVPYPNGTYVRLSNGDIGLVKETLKDFPLRPNVEIIKSKNKKAIGNTISLLEELSIVIETVEKLDI